MQDCQKLETTQISYSWMDTQYSSVCSMQYYPVRNKIAMLRNGGKNEKTNTIGQKEHKDPEDCPCSLSKFTPASFHMYFSFPINFLLFSLKNWAVDIYNFHEYQRHCAKWERYNKRLYTGYFHFYDILEEIIGSGEQVSSFPGLVLWGVCLYKMVRQVFLRCWNQSVSWF